MLDLVIVGSGPAGLTAAIYASRSNLEYVIVEKAGFSGGQVVNTPDIDNYPGLPSISGFELSMKLRKHAEQFGAVFVSDEVTGVEKQADVFSVSLKKGEPLAAKSIVWAAGAQHRLLQVPGEQELKGRGVSYCATCDGAFYRNKTAAVIGGGDVAAEDALYLARLCSRVYLIHRRDSFRAAKQTQELLHQAANIELVTDTVVKNIEGNEFVENLVISDKQDNERRLKVDGVFVAVGMMPQTAAVPAEVKLIDGYIAADESGKTNIAGFFAAGDVRTKNLRQIVTAVSDGANVISSVEGFLHNQQ